MVIGKRISLPKVGSQPRPRHFSCRRLKPDLTPFTRSITLPFRMIFGIFSNSRLFLTHRLITLPHPIHYGGIIALQLPFFGGGISRLTLVGQLHFHPIFNVHHRRIRAPIAFSLIHNLKFIAKPIHRGPHQLIGGHRLMNTTKTIRQFSQWRHHVILNTWLLKRIVHTPVSPHAGDIMMGYMAMK